MGIRVTLKADKIANTEPTETKITVDVQNHGGGGSTFQADVNSAYPVASFDLVAGSEDPRPDSSSGGTIKWNNRTIPDRGVNFTYKLVCKTNSHGGTVTGTASQTGTPTNTATDSKVVACP